MEIDVQAQNFMGSFKYRHSKMLLTIIAGVTEPFESS